MFDLITGNVIHAPRPRVTPVIVSLGAHADEEGRVENLTVLRSPGVFEEAALAAVRQWRYSPVMLNGRPSRLVLTVVVSFHLGK